MSTPVACYWRRVEWRLGKIVELRVGAEVRTGYWQLDLQTWELELCHLSRDMLGFAAPQAGPLSLEEWSNHIHPDDLGGMMEQLWITAEKPQSSYALPFRSLLPNGRVQNILGVGSSIGPASGHVRKLVGANIDLASAGHLITSAGNAEVVVGLAHCPAAPLANDNAEAERLALVRQDCGEAPSHHRELGFTDAVRAVRKQQARAIRDVRQARLRFFDRRMLGEPAFDMLLALYADTPSGEPLSVARIAELVSVPIAQTQRWMAFLVEEELVRLEAAKPHADTARALLTREGRATIEAFLRYVASEHP